MRERAVATAQRCDQMLDDRLAGNMRDALPNASFIDFAGAPIQKNDANMLAVFEV